MKLKECSQRDSPPEAPACRTGRDAPSAKKMADKSAQNSCSRLEKNVVSEILLISKQNKANLPKNKPQVLAEVLAARS